MVPADGAPPDLDDAPPAPETVALAELVYYPDTLPGIRRRRCGKGFSYVATDGTRITDEAECRRLRALAVPPAYRDVWICPRPDGHLLATGRDERGRKQYRYHPDWAAFRARHKYDCLAEFGRCLPAIRRRILKDLDRDPRSPEFPLAAVVALLDRLALRVGNQSYASENGSYGVTTLRRRHLRLRGGEIALSFTSKGGKRDNYRLRDTRLHKALQAMDDLPGGQLFGWRDADGRAHAIMSQQVNAFIVEMTGDARFTAKTFRTWSGTHAAFGLAAATPPEERLTPARLAREAAERLHNTATVARNSYIHPDVLALAEPEARAGLAELEPYRQPGLRAGEGQLIAFLSRMRPG